jgi:hypothetical protein
MRLTWQEAYSLDDHRRPSILISLGWAADSAPAEDRRCRTGLTSLQASYIVTPV